MIVFLVGYMGCGKTTIGRRLARRLGYDFADTDDRIEKQEGADQIVLGCTHYPFLLPVFRQVIGERGVAVVDPSPAVGRRVGQLLDQYDLRAEKGATANYGFLTFADEAYRSRLECKAFG